MLLVLVVVRWRCWGGTVVGVDGMVLELGAACRCFLVAMRVPYSWGRQRFVCANHLLCIAVMWCVLCV